MNIKMKKLNYWEQEVHLVSGMLFFMVAFFVLALIILSLRYPLLHGKYLIFVLAGFVGIFFAYAILEWIDAGKIK